MILQPDDAYSDICRSRRPDIAEAISRVLELQVRRRKLGQDERGTIGLWVGNTSDGDFANLRVTPIK